jgi:VCBS repeat-containing protein
VSLADDNGATVTQDVTIIITGTNDAPVLTVDGAGGVTEDTAVVSGNLTDSGTLSFTDVDTTDTHTVAVFYNDDILWSAGQPVPDEVALTIGFSADTNNWDYAVANAAVQFLAAGETVTFSYSIRVTDDSGTGNSYDTETVTITITGTNDAPILTVDASGGVTEDAVAGNLTDSGALSFADADATDLHMIGVPVFNNDAIWTGGSLSPTQESAIIAGFSVDGDSWDYIVANADVQFLGAGETVTFSYNVTVSDDSGTGNATDTETVTITITGTNDAPVIAHNGNPPPFAEGNTGTPSIQTIDLAAIVTFSDADQNGIPAIAAIAVVANPSNTTTDMSSAFTVVGTTVQFDAAAFDFLNAGETGVYDITFNVVSGTDIVPQTVTVRVNGEADGELVYNLSAGDLDLSSENGLVGQLHVFFDSAAQDITLEPNEFFGVWLSDGTNTLSISNPDTNAVDNAILDFPGFDDTLIVAGDFDNLAFASGNLTINLGEGNDTFDASEANGLLAGQVTINGNQGSDIIIGTAGGDIINGGEGADTLTGGAGADTFVFADLPGVDTILDFSSAEDSLDLYALLDGSFDPDFPELTISAEVNGGGGATVFVNASAVVNLDGVFAGAQLEVFWDTATLQTVTITATA